MRSRWQRSRGDDPQAPIEMRFIDMFMAALGSLVFLALLLVFLLPKTNQQGSNPELKKKLDELTAQNQQLRQQIPTSQAGGANTEEKNIIKRWLGVFLMVRGCDSIEPEMYVRWEGNVVNFETYQPISKLPEFDASDVSHNRDTLIGHKYFDIGNGAEIATIMAKVQELDTAGLEDFNKNGLNAKLFYGVSRATRQLFCLCRSHRPARTGRARVRNPAILFVVERPHPGRQGHDNAAAAICVAPPFQNRSGRNDDVEDVPLAG